MSIAQRRHHRERIKKNRRHHWGEDLLHNPKKLAKAINTPKSCSCHMCGNPRRNHNELTIQERKQSL